MQQLTVAQIGSQLAQWRAEGRRPVLLDVREPWECETASIREPDLDLRAIPMQQIPERLSELPADEPVLVLCHHGMRSLQVALFLDRQGYPHVFNIMGGIDAWSHLIDPSVPRY
ncbi:rhodanese-like domain-containing protein [Leptothrix discophora]|uniref:Rhodanese-like domain-containing protein n=1 Tax=Leptothrix discophora TaxID=89 RepID=A0ABT9G2I3_LEPDI|nr:rhodanese-like domain-containing protein [Leptothrix discophora]MDP4300482.1 rhodanese-like domain-containing protein [Leptothrix discophora]